MKSNLGADRKISDIYEQIRSDKLKQIKNQLNHCNIQENVTPIWNIVFFTLVLLRIFLILVYYIQTDDKLKDKPT